MRAKHPPPQHANSAFSVHVVVSQTIAFHTIFRIALLLTKLLAFADKTIKYIAFDDKTIKYIKILNRAKLCYWQLL